MRGHNLSATIMSIQFRIKDYQFSARYSLTLFTVMTLALFLTLGFWQLARAKEKTLLLQTYESRLHAAPIPLEQLPKNTDLRYHRVQISGRLANAHNIFIDNKIHNHRLGYEVVTPFLLDNGGIVLVNRGWVPAPKSRQTLPRVLPEDERQTLTGMIYIAPGKPFTLGKTVEDEQGWPLRVQVLKIPEIEKFLNRPLYPFIILLDASKISQGVASEKSASAAEPDSLPFVRDWQPVNMPAYKHQGYAAQWFTFAAVLIIIFVALSIKKRNPS